MMMPRSAAYAAAKRIDRKRRVAHLLGEIARRSSRRPRSKPMFSSCVADRGLGRRREDRLRQLARPGASPRAARCRTASRSPGNPSSPIRSGNRARSPRSAPASGACATTLRFAYSATSMPGGSTLATDLPVRWFGTRCAGLAEPEIRDLASASRPCPGIGSGSTTSNALSRSVATISSSAGGQRVDVAHLAAMDQVEAGQVRFGEDGRHEGRSTGASGALYRRCAPLRERRVAPC